MLYYQKMHPFKFKLALVALMNFILSLSAASANFEIIPQEEIALTTSPTLIVTHASKIWHRSSSIKFSLDQLIARSVELSYQNVYLVGLSRNGYFMDDQSPDFAAYSANGELRFHVPAASVILSGGAYNLCLLETLKTLLDQPRETDLKILIPMRSVYYNEDQSLFDWVKRHGTNGLPSAGQTWGWTKVLEDLPNRNVRVFLDKKLIFSHGINHSQKIEITFSTCKEKCI